MNWGKGLVLALSLFIVMIIAFGIYMVTQDTDSLVHEDYYERGLNYDKLNYEDDSGRTTADTIIALPKE
ncbi:FixH family protein [Parapedobacter sp. 2B3]|uniref:FixH family protein n=1 Tax=Parapedobacter sp. 2B3 TaxID=3342381 RepID=UPI0035B62099